MTTKRHVVSAIRVGAMLLPDAQVRGEHNLLKQSILVPSLANSNPWTFRLTVPTGKAVVDDIPRYSVHLSFTPIKKLFMTKTLLTIKNLRTLALAFCLVFVGAGMLTACSEQGPAERAGERVDNAVNDAGDAMRETADDARDAIDEAADDTRDALDN